MKNIREEINKELAIIETISKEIRCSTTFLPAPREFDAVAREIKSHTDRIKDLSYQLGVAEKNAPGLVEALVVEQKIIVKNGEVRS